MRILTGDGLRCRTYVGAAAKAYDRGIISADALARVVKQSVADLQVLEANAAKKPLYNKKYKGE